MSNATIKDILYLFKTSQFIIDYNRGCTMTPLMDWDTAWKYLRDKKLLDTIPQSCRIGENKTIFINLLTSHKGQA